ncbi:MAG: Uma2 family endonuclease [Gemmatirosa sp.]|nr:Uma2 family endonuclease [Gemmatirosa sp.]
MSTTLPAPLTADQFFVHPAAQGPSELVRGEIRVMSPAGGRHGRIGPRLTALLWQHVEQHGLGVVFADSAGFRLTIPGDTEESVRSPDAAVVLAHRMPPDDETIGFMPLAPDLAVEIISPSARAAELQEKLADYLAAGTLAIWALDPARWTVAVYRPDAPARYLRDGDVLDGAPVLPDFHCPVAELFAGTARPDPR